MRQSHPRRFKWQGCPQGATLSTKLITVSSSSTSWQISTTAASAWVRISAVTIVAEQASSNKLSLKQWVTVPTVVLVANSSNTCLRPAKNSNYTSDLIRKYSSIMTSRGLSVSNLVIFATLTATATTTNRPNQMFHHRNLATLRRWVRLGPSITTIRRVVQTAQ